MSDGVFQFDPSDDAVKAFVAIGTIMRYQAYAADHPKIKATAQEVLYHAAKQEAKNHEKGTFVWHLLDFIASPPDTRRPRGSRRNMKIVK